MHALSRYNHTSETARRRTHLKMQVINLSALLLLLGTARVILSTSPAEVTMLSTSPTESAIHTLMEVVKTIPKTTTSHREKRSLSLRRLSRDQFNQCQAVAFEAVCERGGLQEQLYTLAKECGQEDTASVAQFSCGVNDDNGYYCGQALEISQQYNVECSLSSCSSSCRSTLNQINNQLGCCSGHWTESQRGERNVFDGNLWSTCGVSTDPRCPIPTFDSNITTTRSCSLDETGQILFAHRCNQSNSRSAIEAQANTTGCSVLAKVQVEICEVDSNNNFCRFNTGTDNAIRLIQNCASSVSSSSCSSSCQSAMIALRNELGCCLNTHYNGTLARVAPVSVFSQILRYFTNSFWSRCGVSTPGMCESTLTLPDYLADNQPIPSVPTNQPIPSVPTNQPTPSVPDNQPTPSVPDNQPSDGKPSNGSVRLGGVFGLIALLVMTVYVI